MDEEEAAGLRISYWEMHKVVLKDWFSWSARFCFGFCNGLMGIGPYCCGYMEGVQQCGWGCDDLVIGDGDGLMIWYLWIRCRWVVVDVDADVVVSCEHDVSVQSGVQPVKLNYGWGWVPTYPRRACGGTLMVRGYEKE